MINQRIQYIISSLVLLLGVPEVVNLSRILITALSKR